MGVSKDQNVRILITIYGIGVSLGSKFIPLNCAFSTISLLLDKVTLWAPMKVMYKVKGPWK